MVAIGVNCPIGSTVDLPFVTGGAAPTPGVYSVSALAPAYNFTLPAYSTSQNRLAIPYDGAYLISVSPKYMSSNPVVTIRKNGTGIAAVPTPFSIPIVYASTDTFSFAFDVMPGNSQGFVFSIIKY
jgi:hypothetical protein